MPELVTPAQDQQIVDPAQKTQEPTPEEKQAAELEAAQKATAEEEQRRIEVERKLAELETQKREMEFVDSVRDCARANGLKFYVASKELVRLLHDEPGIDVDVQAGTCHINGNRAELVDVLREYATRHENLIERSREELQADRERQREVKSKAELKTWKERAEFIDKHGLRAFEALPLKVARNVPISQMTNEDYHELGWAEKSKIIDKVGERGLAEIMNRRRTK